MQPFTLAILFCVAYSAAEDCSQIEYDKFDGFKKSYGGFKLPFKLLKKFDGGDLVLEFPVEEHEDDMIIRDYSNFPPSVILSRSPKNKRPAYLLYDSSKSEVKNVSAADFIDSIHKCKKNEN
uniref:Secreted protein n=1 Tax=Haemonchus contortus TaxID=6289 RepID=A0A7I4YJJ7_HAECO|nr:unnamed protein product [Haemonchus contortus]